MVLKRKNIPIIIVFMLSACMLFALCACSSKSSPEMKYTEENIKKFLKDVEKEGDFSIFNIESINVSNENYASASVTVGHSSRDDTRISFSFKNDYGSGTDREYTVSILCSTFSDESYNLDIAAAVIGATELACTGKTKVLDNYSNLRNKKEDKSDLYQLGKYYCKVNYDYSHEDWYIDESGYHDVLAARLEWKICADRNTLLD